jgi:drug/metabolite transporter (DMT)-like permease
MHRTLFGFFLVVLVGLFGGATGPIERFAFHAGLTPISINTARLVISTALILAFAAVYRRESLLPGRENLPWHLLNGTVGIGVTYVATNVAFVRIPVGLAMMLFYLAPFWVMIAARLFWKEPVTPLQAACLMLALAGTWIAVGGVSGSRPDPVGLACAVAGGMGYACYILGGRYGVGRKDPFTAYLQAFLWGSLVVSGAALVTGEAKTLLHTTPAGWVSLAILAVVCTVGVYGLLMASLQFIPGSVASIVSMSEIAFAAGWAWLLFREVPSREVAAGGTLIAASVLLLGFGNKKAGPQECEPASAGTPSVPS